MGLTLREQLSSLPVPRLTTVLRVNLSLQNEDFPFETASRLIEDWWNEKAAPYDIGIGSDTHDLSFSRSGFKVEFSRTDQLFALSMEEPDSGVEGRSWIVDVALKLDNGNLDFGLRHSYRQPYNATSSPESRAPRFLRRIVDEIGAVDDCWTLKSGQQMVDSESLPFFLALLQSERRTLPVVAISEDAQTGACFAAPEKLSRILAGTAHVFCLDSYASWGLSRQLGNDWSVYQGAIRCYLPQFDTGGDKSKHRYWSPAIIERLDANLRNGFLNAAVNHVFTQITAQFEAWPLVTPSVVRRQVEEASRKMALPVVTPPGLMEGYLPESGAISVASVLPLALEPASPTESAEYNANRLTELEVSYQELVKRAERHEEVVLRLEKDLEQERAGRAETERALGDTKAELDVVTEVNLQLEQQRAIAFGDASKEQSEALRPLWQNFSGLFTAMQTVAIKFRRMEQDSDRVYELEQELAIAKQTILNQKATIDSLNRRNLGQSQGDPSICNLPRQELVKVLSEIAKKQLTLVAILEALELLFPDRVTILDSAFESAEESSAFQYGEQAFDLLFSLATSYWEEVQSKGDTEARKLFGRSYSAKERTVLTKAGMERRTFDYRGESIQMDKHLKIGTADNPADTLRVHFEWIAEKKRIVIGHCGKHLDF